MGSDMAQGFVYILVSPNSDYIKKGHTERPISERLRGINGGESYAPHGPWELSDFVHVKDCTVVESAAHRHFRDRHASVEGTNELFSVSPHAGERTTASDKRTSPRRLPKDGSTFQEFTC